jgi:hypothetical protein
MGHSETRTSLTAWRESPGTVSNDHDGSVSKMVLMIQKQTIRVYQLIQHPYQLGNGGSRSRCGLAKLKRVTRVHKQGCLST